MLRTRYSFRKADLTFMCTNLKSIYIYRASDLTASSQLASCIWERGKVILSDELSVYVIFSNHFIVHTYLEAQVYRDYKPRIALPPNALVAMLGNQYTRFYDSLKRFCQFYF